MGWKEYIGYGVLVTIMAGAVYISAQAHRKDFCENREPRLYEVLDTIGPRWIDCRNEKKDISDVTRE